MSNPSPILKDTREAKGLTLEIVHEATKIPLDALKAIEQGYSVRILTPFYYRGFVKIYAEFLGLDVEEVFKACNMSKTEKTVVANMPKKNAEKDNDLLRRPAVKHAKVQIPNAFLDQWQGIASSLGKSKVRKSIGQVLLAIAIIFVLVKLGGCVANSIKSKSNTPKSKTASAKTIPVEKSAPSEPKPMEIVKAKSADSHKVGLVVRALKNSWIQVKTDGNTVFAMTMQKGTVESWSARDQIELSGKNIGELELEVNGKRLGSLGTKERRAKKVIITKDGLTVKK